MSAREIYDYVYYKIYKVMDNEVFHWGASWRASAVLLGLFVILLISLDLYYELITGNYLFPTGYEILVSAGILYIVDYFILYSKKQWKAVIEKYDAWPTKKNFRGTLIVWGAIILVIANFLLAIHLYDKVDWTQYQ